MMKDDILCVRGARGDDNNSNESEERKNIFVLIILPTPFKLVTNDFVLLDIHIFINFINSFSSNKLKIHVCFIRN